jgi:serine/threonine protein kinase
MVRPDPSIVPGKTILGSCILVRHIAAGGMGSVWEGWLNPYAELGARLLNGEARNLRTVAGIRSEDVKLSEKDEQKVREWVHARTQEVLGESDLEQKLDRVFGDMADFVAPHRRIAGDFRRAIKILDEGLARNQKIVQRFLKEIDILASTLDHPNVIKVVEAGRSDGRYYAVMEYVSTISLEDAKLSISDVVHVIRKSLGGLIHAHDRGILHRDIKPANILATRDLKKIKLTDFGLAKAIDEGTEGKLTSTGIIMGTPNYLDPERARGEPTVKESDVYSLGATFYKLLTGVPPVQGTTAMDTMGRIGSDRDIPWVRTLRPQVSEELEGVVMMMLSKDLRKRLTTVEVRDALALLDGEKRLLYQEPGEQEGVRRAQRLPKLRRKIRKLRKAILRGKERDGSILELFRTYDELADLGSTKDAPGVSARIDTLAEAMTFHREALAGPKIPIAPAAAGRITFLDKKLALEKRRLVHRGLTYVAPKPPRRLRPVALTLFGVLAVAGLLYYLRQEEESAGKRTALELGNARAELQKRDLGAAERALGRAREDATKLPSSSPAHGELDELTAWLSAEHTLSEGERRGAELEALVNRREYMKAQQMVDGLRTLLRTARPPPASDLERRIQGLLDRTEEVHRRVEPYLVDIRVFKALQEVVQGARGECERMKAELNAGRPPAKAEVTSLRNQLSLILVKLTDPSVVAPEAIGSELGDLTSLDRSLLAAVDELLAKAR